ncbi:hypothetical protein F5882DRAFT_441850 [Hyaloscypha sp. PMI_1271]|nr:hypothetical protein F5882DRAFT_441850 [Hyaloscypha sp. PMI_1271]
METIENIFSSNIAKNDEAAHGSSRERETTTYTGEGSHLAVSHNTTAGTSSGLPGSQASGVGEGSHFAQAHNTTAGTSPSLIGNQTSGITNTSNTSTPNPAARDAAVAASGVGLAEQNTQGVGNSQGAGFSSTPVNDLPIFASMEAGGYTGTNQGSSTHTRPTGMSVQGPYSTNTANRLDPAVNNSGTPHLENTHEHSEEHGGGSRAADKQHLDQHDAGGQTAEKHHLGRDAALGGEIGASTYSADKHHHRSEAKDSNTVTGASHPATTAATTTTTNSGL